jgi:hypothetical protein
MAIHNRPMFRRVKAIIFESVASTAAGSVDTISSTLSTAIGANFDITVHCSTGSIFINPLAAATTTNGFKMIEGQSLDLKVFSALSIIGDSTTAKYQAVVWE